MSSNSARDGVTRGNSSRFVDLADPNRSPLSFSVGRSRGSGRERKRDTVARVLETGSRPDGGP